MAVICISGQERMAVCVVTVPSVLA